MGITAAPPLVSSSRQVHAPLEGLRVSPDLTLPASERCTTCNVSPTSARTGSTRTHRNSMVYDQQHPKFSIGFYVCNFYQSSVNPDPQSLVCCSIRLFMRCYLASKGLVSSTPSWSKSLTFRVTTVSRCILAVAAIMTSSVIVSDLLCISRAHSRKAGASIGNTP